MLFNRRHPLAAKNGMLYEHRQVLYDAIGPGPHPCYWCRHLVDWMGGKPYKGALVPDHLDGDKTNNALSNLAPACNQCNAGRGAFMRWVERHKDDPVLWKMYQEALGKGIADGTNGPIAATHHSVKSATEDA